DLPEAPAVALGGELRHRIRRDREGGEVLSLWQRAVGSIQRGRGSEDHALDALVTSRQQHVQCADDVRRVAGQGVLDGPGDRGERRLVEDESASANGGMCAFVALYV